MRSRIQRQLARHECCSPGIIGRRLTLKNALIILVLVTMSSGASAQFMDEEGFTDYGLVRQAISNGVAVPSAKTMLLRSTPKLFAVGRGEQGMLSFGVCTGALIAPDVVLTAAHCVSWVVQPQDLIVRFDSLAIAGAGIVTHPEYRPFQRKDFLGMSIGEGGDNDIALVFLSSSMPSTHVPALLPPQGAPIVKGLHGIVAGFGMISKESGVDSAVLRWTRAPLVDAGDSRFRIVGQENLCKGDSGGPTYLGKNDRYVVIGIHSQGDCRRVGYDSKVSFYVEWIRREIDIFRRTRSI